MTIRWGIAGTGGIAHRFTQALKTTEGGEVYAVASRTKERAAEFAALHAIPQSFGSLEELVSTPSVDIVYVASPHSEHLAQGLTALHAGKPVLIEKPLALSHFECTQLVSAAQAKSLFLMEAIWSRFLPAYVHLRELLGEQALGQVLSVESDLGFAAPFDATHRIYRKDLGGGVLMDMGVYPLQLAQLVLGAPVTVRAAATLGPTGVDHDTVVSLAYAGGASARTHSSLTQDLPGISRITGERGWIELPSPVFAPEALLIGPERRLVQLPVGEHGLSHQIREVHRCLLAGELESPVMPWAESLLLAGILDDVRSQVGVHYS